MFGHPVVSGEATELKLFHPGEETALVEMRVVEMDWEGQIAFLASLRNITDRNRTEAELHQYREHLEELVSVRTEELEAGNTSLQSEIAEA